MVKRRRPKAKKIREVETRQPNLTTKPKIVFSFEHFLDHDDVGQSLATWVDNNPKLLQGLFEKLQHLSSKNTATLSQDDVFTLYGDFPSNNNTDFKCPPNFNDKSWGVIRNIGGQKARVAGFLENNVFYLVFLDAEHKFWKSK